MPENSERKKGAIIIRMFPGGVDRMDEALSNNVAMIGWSEARGLLSEDISQIDFRQIIHDSYHSDETSYRKSAKAASSVWLFIREIQSQDFAVVPYGPNFYVAEILSDACYDQSKVEEDTAYRRRLNWLNNKKPIPRKYAPTALQSGMKSQQTCIYANDLIDAIESILKIPEVGKTPSFKEDLRRRLIEQTLIEIRSGRMNNFDFERLVQTILRGMGGFNVRIIPRNLDKGGDIIANFTITDI